jgi:hypothetical protein
MIFATGEEYGPIDVKLELPILAPEVGTLCINISSDPENISKDVFFNCYLEAKDPETINAYRVFDYKTVKPAKLIKNLLIDTLGNLSYIYTHKDNPRGIERLTYNSIDYFLFASYRDKFFIFQSADITHCKAKVSSIYDYTSVALTRTIKTSVKNYKAFLDAFFPSLIYPLATYCQIVDNVYKDPEVITND